MSPTHLMIIGFGALLIIVAAVLPQAGWNIYVIGLGVLHVLVGNILVFRQMKRNFDQNMADADTRLVERKEQL